jgi:hypothetical protein
MFNLFIRSVSWKTFAAGAATAVVGNAVGRPVIVALFKAGLGVKSAVASAYTAAGDAYDKARGDVRNLHAETSGASLSGLAEEIKQLREDVAALKTQACEPTIKA